MRRIRHWILGYGIILTATCVLISLTNQTITVFSENSPFRKRQCIVIDPGHGGEDGGTCSPDGIKESAYNLEIGLRLNDLFHLLGYDTVMTRETDISIYTQGNSIAQRKSSDLKERIRIVNDRENSILLSIHQNHFPDGKYRGAQVFYASGNDSKNLAASLQYSLIAHLNPGSNREAKPAKGIYLMEHIYTTGLLIECGFLSNTEEAYLLRTPEYQKRLCCIIATSIAEYLYQGYGA